MDDRNMIANPLQVSLDFGEQHQYRVRRSKRAKYLRINIHPRNGIEVVVPWRMGTRHIQPFVQKHRQWINEQVTRLDMDRATSLPDCIHLNMNQTCWQVRYECNNTRRYRLKQSGGQLTISGPDKDLQKCLAKLNQWLREQARVLLRNRLDDLCQSTGLGYRNLSVRTQKTRWGSCSSRGDLSLNDRLILLPAELTDYVLIHELCHTRHLNHSRKFWQLVESYCPDYKMHQKQLRQARQLLPHWV